ncbi:MAG TPA: hypothetical protein VJ773_04950 [Gemmatimonadales bacterium]|nr:hypothetical protein [Gemmatimonadales bacterium]
MPYPCEDDPTLAKEHEMMKGGKKGDLRRKVDCAIESRDQWMVELTDWLRGMQQEMTQLRQRVEECEKACSGTTAGAPQMMMMAMTQDPPKPPKPWP